MVATDAALELQAAWLVRFTVVPDEVVPIARNWLVSGGAATDCALGMMESDVMDPVDEPAPVTVMVVEAGGVPDKLAVIVLVPAETAAASPVEFTVATSRVLEAQVTWSVKFLEPVPCPVTPVAVNCTVWPAATYGAEGEIEMEFT
jgi:hypothetical protein